MAAAAVASMLASDLLGDLDDTLAEGVDDPLPSVAFEVTVGNCTSPQFVVTCPAAMPVACK